MTLFEAMRAKLLAAVAVTSVIGNTDSVHVGHVPARSAYPLVLIAGTPGGDPAHMHLSGAALFGTPLVTVECLAESVEQVLALASAVDATLSGVRGLWSTIFVHGCVRRDRRGPDPIDLQDGAASPRFLVQLDYMVGHDTPA